MDTPVSARPTTMRNIALVACAAAIVVLVAWWAVGVLGPRPSAADLLAGSQVAATDVTAETCLVEDIDCVEAWRTEYGLFLRFSNVVTAEHWATVLGDEGRRYRDIVLDMRGQELTFDQRRRAIDILFSRHDWG